MLSLLLKTIQQNTPMFQHYSWPCDNRWLVLSTVPFTMFLGSTVWTVSRFLCGILHTLSLMRWMFHVLLSNGWSVMGRWRIRSTKGARRGKTMSRWDYWQACSEQTRVIPMIPWDRSIPACPTAPNEESWRVPGSALSEENRRQNWDSAWKHLLILPRDACTDVNGHGLE